MSESPHTHSTRTDHAPSRSSRLRVPWWLAWRHGTESVDGDGHQGITRLEAFSDGVIAIAITLLILDIRVPRVDSVSGASALLDALGHQWPAYLSYVLSFILIGIMWANHTTMFRYLRRTNHILLMLNTLFLMCIAFLPFATSLMAEYITESREEQRIVVLVYGKTLPY